MRHQRGLMTKMGEGSWCANLIKMRILGTKSVWKVDNDFVIIGFGKDSRMALGGYNGNSLSLM